MRRLVGYQGLPSGFEQPERGGLAEVSHFIADVENIGSERPQLIGVSILPPDCPCAQL